LVGVGDKGIGVLLRLLDQLLDVNAGFAVTLVANADCEQIPLRGDVEDLSARGVVVPELVFVGGRRSRTELRSL
jgi:hypothetical protein